MGGDEAKLKKLQPIIEEINQLEPNAEKLTDSQLREKTAVLRQRLIKGETLDALLPEAFSLVREAAKRTGGDIAIISQCLGRQGLSFGYS
ncbi:MAG: preprotein translocase subunit SecA [Candidatus Berkelbacteria bacterium Licking1014_2]|uniref:Preprotein translocase subunit SecA n=1 Tax=Candidatus Berkelbacteria bacterium Licking1014_2 TaxID=2017146 RepID=A0A554LUL7_9BACT|nr:MAG: preprotein translocase subunit SecA [Candidatus Berkelbacteria bacterium Licking1014_2]